MSMKLLIVGGVAGGASAATRARRLNEHAEIILFERGKYVSFANCGLPYYIGNEIKDRDDLLVTTVELLQDRFNIDVRILSEVVEVDAGNRQITVRNVETDETYTESYDKLILSPGGLPIKPPLEGINLDTVFTLWTIPDSDRIKAYVDKKKPESAVVIGGGFIGLEMAENLIAQGIKVTIVEMLNQLMPPLDFEMCSLVHKHMVDSGVHLHLSDAVKSFRKENGRTVVTTSQDKEFECDMVMLCIGVRPENILAKKAGIEMGERGGIKTDATMQTSDPHIYAAGDVVEVTDFVSKQPAMMPLAGPANKQGRIAANNVSGRNSVFNGTQGSAIVKVFDLTVALTGNNEKTLKRYDIPYLVSYTQSGSHASYYPGAQNMNIKLIFSPEEGKVLGAQIVGMDGVDKRIDVLATAIRAGLTVYDLEELELAYAPPYSSAKDPVNMAGFVASNILKGDLVNIHWDEVDQLDGTKEVLLDVRDNEEVEMHAVINDAVHIPLNQLRSRLSELDKDKTYIIYCAMGLRGYIAYRMLVQHGFKCKNLSGGYNIYMAPKVDLSRPDEKPEQHIDFAERCLDNYDFEVNACGIPCPGPILKLARKVKEMEDGQVLKISASDVGFSKDLPGWCFKTGNELITMVSDKGIFNALVRKGLASVKKEEPIPEPETGAEEPVKVIPGVDFEVNACGVPCPGPILKLARKIKQMEVGQVMMIKASDVGFSKDVPGWCHKTRNELLSLTKDKGIISAVIRKGAK